MSDKMHVDSAEAESHTTLTQSNLTSRRQLTVRKMNSAKVGTRFFFLSPLPLVRYLEIVLPLRTGLLFSKIC